MGWHLDGKVTAVVGTHTHVQTADERILPKGTAYLTDVGMTGPHDSIIGVEIEAALGRFLTALPAEVRDGDRQPAAERGHHRGRRADRARDRHRAPQLQRRRAPGPCRCPICSIFRLKKTASDEAAARADARPLRRAASSGEPSQRRGRRLRVASSPSPS